MNILIVEDNLIAAIALEGALVEHGHSVVGPASSRHDALALVEPEQPFDLALVDVNLLDGKRAGIDLARQLMDQWRIPPLFVSGNLEAAAMREVGLGYIAKPCDPELVLECVEIVGNMLGGQPAPKALPSALHLFI